MSKAVDISALERHLVRTQLNSLTIYSTILQIENQAEFKALKNLQVKASPSRDLTKISRLEFEITPEDIKALRYSPNFDDAKRIAADFSKFVEIKKEMEKRKKKK